MELKEYLKIFRKYLALIAALSFIGMSLAFAFARRIPQGYQDSQTFFISPQSAAIQMYEGYYGQEKARNFTDTAVAILDSPDFKSEVQGTNEAISVRKMAPQVVRLTATSKSSAAAKNLLDKTVNSFNSKLQSLSGSQAQIQLKAIGRAQGPSTVAVNRKVFALVGLIAGFAFATAAISLKTYFKI